MTATDITEDFRSLEATIAAQRGGFTLFALFMREDVPDRWDLIVSAPWAFGNKEAAVSFLVERIKSTLGEGELSRLSRIVIADPDDEEIQALNRAIQTEHGSYEVRDSVFFGLPVKQAIIITSKRPTTNAAV